VRWRERQGASVTTGHSQESVYLYSDDSKTQVFLVRPLRER